MKKKLFLFATAALVLAGCNNDVTIDENTALEGSNAQKEIALSSYAQTPKRAAWNGANFPGQDAGYGIKLAAYDATKEGLYFNDGDYTWSSGTGASIIYHDATIPRYWPFTEAWIHFLGVSYMTTPAQNAITASFSTYGTAGTAAVTLADNSTLQNDLMYAIGYGHVQQAGNALIFPENVPMVFHHALAYLGFRVKANVADKINVTSIVVNGAYEAGVFNITHTGYDNKNATESVAGTWDVSSASTGARTVPGTNPLGNLGTSFSDEKGLLVVPVSGGNSFTSFTINYQLGGVDYAYTYTPTSLTLEKQKKYLYDISFTMHEILVNATVTDWDATTPTTNVDIPMETYAHSTTGDNGGNFPKSSSIAKTAGTYSFCVTGLTSTNDVTVAEGTTGERTGLTISHVYDTESKVAIVTFTIPANPAAPANTTYAIDITDNGSSGDGNKTTILVKQAGE